MNFQDFMQLNEDLDNTSAMEQLNDFLMARSNEEMKAVLNAVNFFTREEYQWFMADEELNANNVSQPFISHIHNDAQNIIQDNYSNEMVATYQTSNTGYYSSGSVTSDKVRRSLQNKRASTRYRNKKKEERQNNELQRIELNKHNHTIKQRLKKLQNEFKVVYQLAKNSLAADSGIRLSLKLLKHRVIRAKLLE